MFEQAFKNIDDVLWKEAGCTTELDYTEQTSWLLFLKYLDGLEQDRADEAALDGKKYSYILEKQFRWDSWAAPKGKGGKIDHNRAMTGADLVEFVNQKLVPYLHGFKLKASGPNTIEYKAFDGIATAKANAEKNLKNARALFESHLNAAFTQRGYGWVEKRLEEIVTKDCSLSYGIVQPGHDQPSGLPIVRPTDFTQQLVRLDGLKRIDPKRAEGYQRTKLNGGELLLCVRGSTGGVAIASEDLAGGNVSRGIVPIRFLRGSVDQRFGYYSFLAPAIQEQIRNKTKGAALRQINIRDLRSLTFQLPSLTEQTMLASNLDAIALETQRLESIYQRKLAALDELKESLLHRAFSGQL